MKLPALLFALPLAAQATSVWIEGESPASSTMHRHPWWYDKVKKEVLSGGDWISNFGKESGEAEYRFGATASDDFTFWVRANPLNSRLSYRLDDGAWTEINLGDKRGQQNIAEDNKFDLRFIAWSKVGKVSLKAGAHTIRFRLDSPHENHGGLDCFVFTTDPFVPQGTLKPGEGVAGSGVAAGPADWFPLLVDEDTMDPRSVIDLSSLIPAPAGQFGFLRAAGDKLQFEKAKTPIKFWGAGANVEPGKFSREQLTQRAKYLRKFGINTVRQHAMFDELTSKGQLDPKKLDQYDWWFAELKKHGIYSDWSIFYHFTIGPDDGYPADLYSELEKHGDRKDTYGIITMSPKLWEIRNRWMTQLLQHKNPYTGLRYVDDPALIAVELQNEDSIFFWNPLGWLAEGKKMPNHSRLLRERFATWVKSKYSDDTALKAAWGQLKEGDSVSAKELHIMSPWELDGKTPRGRFAGQTRRAGDYIQFLAEMQRADFDRALKAIRDAGFKGIMMTTAWQVGGSASEAANLWTDTAADMIDRHNYFGGGAGGHGISEGKVENGSHLRNPGSGIFTTAMKQVENKPFAMTEWTQCPPNQWKLECAPIFAFYGMGLQGWDASWHFAQSGSRLGDGWPDMSSYRTDTPHFIGQFPALAFAIHYGHIKEAPIAAARRLTMNDVYAGTDAFKQDATKGGYDAKTMIVDGGTPLEAFAIGRVTASFAGGKTEQADFTKYWDTNNKTIRSMTDELTWDYARQLILVRTPKTQAILGRPGDQPVALPSVTATIMTPFVSLIFTPLDDAPLVESKRILITALAQDKQSGARYNSDGTQLESVGTSPLLLEPVQATLKLAGAKPAAVTPCDHYGVPREKKLAITADGSFQIDGTSHAYYYLVTR
jgi:hypothetical protein